MNVYVMVNDYSCNGVFLFTWHTYSFLCTIRKSMLEVDCGVDNQTRSRTTHWTLSSKASGFYLCIFYLYPINAYNNVYFLDILHNLMGFV
jgi:hypothetical protein